VEHLWSQIPAIKQRYLKVQIMLDRLVDQFAPAAGVPGQIQLGLKRIMQPGKLWILQQRLFYLTLKFCLGLGITWNFCVWQTLFDRAFPIRELVIPPKVALLGAIQFQIDRKPHWAAAIVAGHWVMRLRIASMAPKRATFAMVIMPGHI